MELVAYQDTTVFDELKSEWNDLLGRAPINNIFYTWEWHSTWWDAYHPGELLVLACRNEGQLVGIASLFVAQGDAGRAVHFVGCIEVTDYLDFIVDKDHAEAVYAEFVQYFKNHRGDTFDFLDFCNVPQESLTYEILPRLLTENGFDTNSSKLEVCPVIDLPDDWGGYLSQLEKKQRHEVRPKLRRPGGH